MKKQIVHFARSIVQRFPRTTMTYRFVRDNWPVYNERETAMGFKLAGNKAMQTGQFEPEETQIIERIIPNVDVVINIGANIGYYCCIALSYRKHVVAFEPIPLNVQYLLRNLKANNWESNVEVYPLALANKVGVVGIYGRGTGASLVKGWAGMLEKDVSFVPSSTLDIILGSRFEGKKCLALVDMEGAEQSMLKGASSFIDAKPKPIWMIEVCIAEHQPKGIHINPNLLSTFQVFWERGYEAWTADKQCRIIRRSEVEAIAESGVDSLNTHNFLFIEEGRKSELLNA